MLSDLLARNFETMDVRPLFEDLDRRLTDLIECGGEGHKVLPGQAEAFRQREQLRRVARGATTRQIELLRANARAEVQQVRIKQCQPSPSSPPVFTPDELPALTGKARGVINRVADGSVSIALRVPTDAPVPVASPNGTVESPPIRQMPLTVTFFDMPTLENVRLPGGRRVALALTGSASTRTCERFALQMDETARQDCNSRLDVSRERAVACSWADVSITLIPKDYIGMRDRPYLSELSTRRSTLFDTLRKLLPYQSLPVSE
jgi:hypothetical protein